MTGAAQGILDRVHSLPALVALEADPGAYAAHLADELPAATTRAELATRDEHLGDALARIDALAERAMRIRIDHALADDASIAIPTRKVFVSTMLAYELALGVLEMRARDVASRGGSRDPVRTAAAVVEAARAAFVLRDAIRDEVLALVSRVVTESVPLADGQARDRRLDEPVRRAWSALRRELQAVAAQPVRITGPLAERLAYWPEQLDEPDPALEPTLADLIELD